MLLSCQRKVIQNIHTNSSYHNCTWISSANAKSLISYNIWLVNGHPNSASNKLIDFDHQFSFEQQVHKVCYKFLCKVYIISLFFLEFAHVYDT